MDYDSWKNTTYGITHNGFGYAAFENIEDQKNCIENYRSMILPTVQTPKGLEIVRFDANIKKKQYENA